MKCEKCGDRGYTRTPSPDMTTEAICDCPAGAALWGEVERADAGRIADEMFARVMGGES